ncbi:MAG: hypothetical protein ACOX9C_10810 [Kiritimatiellia bacterium]|jgi:hypothetical protein
MKRRVVALLMVALFSSTAQARFSEFVRVAPGIETKSFSSGLSISVNPVLTMVESVESGTNVVTVTIPLKGYKQHQHYWMIRCKTPVEDGKVNFREDVWGVGRRDGVVGKEIIPIPVEPDQESLIVAIPVDAIDRSYIHRDYPRWVEDGGYYYCFDLPAYYRKFKEETGDGQD